MTQDADVIMEWIEAVQGHGRGLTKWEEEFIDSIADQMEERGNLSGRQEEILERIDLQQAADSERMECLIAAIRCPGVMRIECDDQGNYAIGDQIEDGDFYPSLRDAIDALTS